jgi:glucuronate isomerase
MILYNLNLADNYAFAAMIGNFLDGSVPGKIQLRRRSPPRIFIRIL